MKDTTTISPTAASVQPIKPTLEDAPEHYTSLDPHSTDHLAESCDCSLVRDDSGTVRLYHCPMHAAAPDLARQVAALREALKAAYVVLEKSVHFETSLPFWKKGGDGYQAMLDSRAALANATGGEKE